MYGLLAPEDKQQAIYQGLMGLGAGLASGSAPSSKPMGLLGGINQGLAGFQQGVNGYSQGVQRNKMAGVQMAELEENKRRRDAQNKMIENLPENERLAAMAAPDAYFKAKFSSPSDGRTSAQKNAEAMGFQPGTQPYNDYIRQATLKTGKPDARFETVKNPFGRGGVGQRNMATGQVVNYQGPSDLDELRIIEAMIDETPMASTMRPQLIALRDRIISGKSLVNVDMGGGDKTSPELLARYEAANTGYNSATESLDRLKALGDIVGNVESGWGAETALNTKKLLMRAGFDVDPEQIANAEMLQKFSIESVMDIVAQTKGAVSNREMEMFMAAAPSLANSPEGNKRIVEYSRKIVERQRELDSYMARKVRENPQMSVFEYDAIRNEKQAALRDKPLFDEKDMLVLTGGPAPADGNGGGGEKETPDLDGMLQKYRDLAPFVD